MIRFLIAILLAIGFGCPAFAQPPAAPPSVIGTPIPGDCVKWAPSSGTVNTNPTGVMDAGAPCASGGGGITALTGDVTASGSGSVAASVVGVNGAAVPTSQACLGSNSSGQFVACTTTGTGTTLVLSTSPTLVTPALGTPSSATLTNATGLPVSTGITGFGTGVATFLGTPSATNLGSAVTGAAIVAGTNVTVSGTWPNQTVNSTVPSTINALTTWSLTGQTANTEVFTTKQVNATAATAANQQWDCQQLSGQGWGTTAPASVQIDFALCNVPIQGATASGDLNIYSQVNGGGYTSIFTLTSAGQVNLASTTSAPRFSLNSGFSEGAQAAVVYSPAANQIALGTNSLERELIDANGHISYYSTAPTVSACGTSPSIDAHASDQTGTVTVGTGTIATCTITFGAAYATWNHCRVSSQLSSSGFAYSYSLTALTVTAASLTSNKIDYECDGT